MDISYYWMLACASMTAVGRRKSDSRWEDQNNNCGEDDPASYKGAGKYNAETPRSSRGVTIWRRILCFPKPNEGLGSQSGWQKSADGKIGMIDKVDLVVPVPLSYWRLFSRGYNQASVLARPIARKLGVPFKSGLVGRIHRDNQGHKSISERRRNIAGVFRVRNATAIKGKHILIIDDVVTTGATIDELARCLKRAGASRVSAISFARVVRDI